MEVKEAIGFLDKTLYSYQEHYSDNIREVILLIKQLDKSNQMWKRLGLVYINEYRKIREEVK